MSVRPLQIALLILYRGAVKAGLLRTRIGRWSFDLTYDLYKRFFEAGYSGHLEAHVLPGTTVIDVGANTGFFTLRFSHWAGPDGRVIAVEPEDANVRQLRQRIERRAGCENIHVVQAAASDMDGSARLALNPYHPGDHRLSEQGVQVTCVTLDRLLAEHGGPPVSLIKIDVQGAEAKVIAGARQIIARHHPALLVEVDHKALAAMGSGAAQLFALLSDMGYRFHVMGKAGPSAALTTHEATSRATARDGYFDFLCLAG